ncbi:MAG: non-canonical purine NTP pyrophosphatase [Candidatus Paceibacterota bacterium]
MKLSLTFVTGNAGKAKEIEEQLRMPVEQHALDLHEIQSLDLREILEAKARAAFARLQRPVIVDDASVIFTELNGLPGPLIKWFINSIGNDGLCRLADLTKGRTAIAEVGIGYCDVSNFEAFIATKNGTIATEPRGTNGYGWDPIFVQEGYTVTRGELNDEEYKDASIRHSALEALKTYLDNQK